jgi:putative DNA primase/helicase
LAVLRGARLVTAQETEQGRPWAEAKIKAMTGGDPITANFMRQDSFIFTPQFKLLIAGNHKPAIRNVDDAISRRLHLIPFAVKIPQAEQDGRLPEKLRAEWPGILAWAVQGCLQWQSYGLAPPAAVRSATEAYLGAEDAVGRWIADCCEHDVQASTGSTPLFASWSQWATAAGEFVGSQKRLTQALESHGFVAARTSSNLAAMRGLTLRPQKAVNLDRMLQETA